MVSPKLLKPVHRCARDDLPGVWEGSATVCLGNRVNEPPKSVLWPF